MSVMGEDDAQANELARLLEEAYAPEPVEPRYEPPEMSDKEYRRRRALSLLGDIFSGIATGLGTPTEAGASERLAREIEQGRYARQLNRGAAERERVRARRERARYEIGERERRRTEEGRQARSDSEERARLEDAAGGLELPLSPEMPLEEIRRLIRRARDEKQRRKEAREVSETKEKAESRELEQEAKRLDIAHKREEKATGFRQATEAERIRNAQEPIERASKREERDLQDLREERRDAVTLAAVNPAAAARLKEIETQISEKKTLIAKYEEQHQEMARQVREGPGSAYYFRNMTAELWKKLTAEQQREFVSIYGRKPAGVK